MTAGEVRQTLLAASVGPLASSVIVSRFGLALEETARNFELVGTPEAVGAAKQLRRALAEMRESARLRNLARAEIGSGGGTAEPAGVAPGPELGAPPWIHLLRVSQVVERLGVSGSYVRRMCRDGDLSATKVGREWLIEEQAVADLLAARSVA